VAALVTVAGPVRYLIAAPSVRGQKLERQLVLISRAIVVLLAAGPFAPLQGAGGGRQMVAAFACQTLGAGVVERQSVQREVVRG
jgi:hypothetical protein